LFDRQQEAKQSSDAVVGVTIELRTVTIDAAVDHENTVDR